MNTQITLTLNKPLIMESVKNETFRKGQFDKSLDQKAMAVAYQEQAGDDTYHERTLERALYTSLEELKSHLYDYISVDGFTAADNSIESSNDGDNILIKLTVTNRFNKAYTQSLARLSSAYVENEMLFLWWSPINEKQATFYAQIVERNLTSINRCFHKTAPTVPTVPYTTILDVPGDAIDLGIGEEHTVTYSISDGAIDDIEVRIEDRKLIEAGRTDEGFTIIGRQLGHTYIEIYSRHNPELSRTIHVYVTDQS
jgi:hypothetical protein